MIPNPIRTSKLTRQASTPHQLNLGAAIKLALASAMVMLSGTLTLVTAQGAATSVNTNGSVSSDSGGGGGNASGFTQYDPAVVYLAMWRGCVSACQSFREYFEERELPVRFELRDVCRDKSLIPTLQDEIIRERPDLVVSWGTSLTSGLIGKRATYGADSALGDINSLFMIVADPVSSDLIDSYQTTERPFITGVRNRVPEQVQFSTIFEYFRPSKIGVVLDPSEANAVNNLSKVQDLALDPAFQFDVHVETLSLDADGKPNSIELPLLVEKLAMQDVDLLYVGSGSFLLQNKDVFTQAAVRNGLPVVSAYVDLVQNADGLLAVGNQYENVGRLAARQANDILFRGQSPGDLPVKSLSRFSVYINMDVARSLSLYPPLDLLQVAQVVNPFPGGEQEGSIQQASASSACTPHQF